MSDNNANTPVQSEYNLVLDPKLPLLDLGTGDKPIFVPAEQCTIVAGQPVRAKLTADETTDMLRFACRSPYANAFSILESRKNLGYDENPRLVR